MSKAKYSKPHFFAFLEYVENACFKDEPTVRQWHAAAQNMLDDLSSDETRDLRSLDLDALGERCLQQFGHEPPKLTPWALKHNKQVLRSAIGEFIAYVVNPARYRAEQLQRNHRPLSALSPAAKGFPQVAAG